MPWVGAVYSRQKNCSAGGALLFSDVNAIQDDLGNEISTLRAAGQQAWQSVSWGSGIAGTLRYYKDGTGLVHIAADGVTVTPSIAAGTLVATLPAGYRPGADSYFPLVSMSSSPGTQWALKIATNGQVTAVVTITSSGTFALTNGHFRAEN